MTTATSKTIFPSDGKQCISCGELKPLEEYYSHPQTKDGHLGKCKSCVKQYTKTYRQTNPEKCFISRLKTCEKNPNKYNAHKAVEAALAAGELNKPKKCESCGVEGNRLESHHEDYAEPLDVDWWCAGCHRTHHQGWENVKMVYCPECGAPFWGQNGLTTHQYYKHGDCHA